MIRFKDVTYAYPNGTTVLNNVDLHIGRGERLAIVGDNGSGKTTLALLINGVLRVSSGSISVDGLNPSRNEDNLKLKHKVGLVFQNPDNQLVSTTVEREVAFSLENMNVAFDDMQNRVDRMLDFFGLNKFRKKLTSDLSGGEKQRLALAAVMVAEPDILILDEPGSYLDQTGKNLLNKAVDHLLADKPGLTVLRITQYSDEAALYNRLLVFRDGQIAADGNPDDIFRKADRRESIGVSIPLKYRIDRKSDTDAESQGEYKTPEKGSSDRLAIELDSVSFSYNDGNNNMLFDKLKLRLESGRVYGLVGPSGSGKTTLVQLMAGLLKPDSGKVNYEGFEAEPGRMAVSFQQPERQFFLDTVEAEIRFGAENLELPEIESITERCYYLTGLDREIYSGRNPFSLSGGEKRKLAFGTILSLQPSFIFFDEPTCGLDWPGVIKFRRLVGQLREGGIGIVIISHFGDVILNLADEVIVLKNGRIDMIKSREDFFMGYDYSEYLSTPDLLAYQLENMGEVKYLSEAELLSNKYDSR